VKTPAERIRQQYLLERELANEIRKSAREDRKRVTREAYRRLYAEIPWHVSRQKSGLQIQAECRYYIDYLKPYLRPSTKVLELGCGAGHLAQAIAGRVGEVVGIDTALTVTLPDRRENLRLIEADVAEFHLPDKDFDLVFSTHLIEHLHPDDLEGHLRSILAHLRPGGSICIFTPHWLTGPHDVSRLFDDRATGFHLKEYGYRDLVPVLIRAGFEKPRVQVLPRRLFRLSGVLFRLGSFAPAVEYPLEWALGSLPWKRARQNLGTMMHFGNLILYAKKP
jgi:SAM-dependent methyltransferase